MGQDSVVRSHDVSRYLNTGEEAAGNERDRKREVE